MVSGNMESSIVIFAVIILNAILGTVQHLKAEASLASLKAMSSPNAKVIRDGIKKEIKSLFYRCLYVIHELRFNKIVV